MAEPLPAKMAQVARAVAAGRYHYTYHGAQQRIARGIYGHDVETALANGEIIEDYPHHRYGPACLILGAALRWRPAARHVLAAGDR